MAAVSPDDGQSVDNSASIKVVYEKPTAGLQPWSEDLGCYTADFGLLHDLKTQVINDLLNTAGPAGECALTDTTKREFGSLPDGRLFCQFYPQGRAAMLRLVRDTAPGTSPQGAPTPATPPPQAWPTTPATPPPQAWFVGFFGTAVEPEKVSEALKNAIWDVDGILINDFPNHPHILCYASAETTPGGDWFNLVLFDSETALSQWRTARGHRRAVMEISPEYYKKVRIHRGILVNGASEAQFRVLCTTFLDYTHVSLDGIVDRQAVTWPGAGDSNVIDVRTHGDVITQ